MKSKFLLEKSRQNLKDFILTWPNFVAKVNFRRFGNKIGWITSIMKRKTLPLSYTNRVLGVKFQWFYFEDLFKFHVELLTKPPFLESNFLVKSQYCYYISCWTAHKASVFGIQLSSEESVLLLHFMFNCSQGLRFWNSTF